MKKKNEKKCSLCRLQRTFPTTNLIFSIISFSHRLLHISTPKFQIYLPNVTKLRSHIYHNIRQFIKS